MFSKYLGAIKDKLYTAILNTTDNRYYMVFDEPMFMLQARVLYVMCDQIGAPIYGIDRFYKMCAQAYNQQIPGQPTIITSTDNFRVPSGQSFFHFQIYDEFFNTVLLEPTSRFHILMDFYKDKSKEQAE